MHNNLGDLPFVAIYIDNIIIHSPDDATHMEHVGVVLARLREANVCINARKSIFAARRMQVFGVVLTPSGIEIDPEKAAAIRDYPRPETGKQMQALLGTCNYCRQFLPHYATLVRPFDILRQVKGRISWTEELERAFLILRQEIDGTVASTI